MNRTLVFLRSGHIIFVIYSNLCLSNVNNANWWVDQIEEFARLRLIPSYLQITIEATSFIIKDKNYAENGMALWDGFQFKKS